jgi:tyramine---L-glutamate ligase
MRLLVFEFITGGGMIGTPLPPSLLLEGGMMRNALLADLAHIPSVDVTLTRDSRCPWPDPGFPFRRIECNIGENGLELFERALVDVDVVWPIAPETGGVLAQLAKLALKAGKFVCLSDPETLAICASKYETASVLHRAGVNVVPSFRPTDSLPHIDGQWVSKPDVGAGGYGIQRWPSRNAASQAVLATKQYSSIVQPFYAGESLSLSIFCNAGAAWLLSINQQHVLWRDDQVFLAGLTVNSIPPSEPNYCALAQQIVTALPGLSGYVGVDLVRSEDGVLTVLEVNPRLTTPYCGLRDALGINVARLVLDKTPVESRHNIANSKNKLVQLDLCAAHA